MNNVNSDESDMICEYVDVPGQYWCLHKFILHPATFFALHGLLNNIFLLFFLFPFPMVII